VGKNRRGSKEYSKEQELVYENRKLRREIGHLRKQLARVDLDRYTHVKDIIEKSYRMEEELEGQKILQRLRAEWKCHECERGFLQIVTYNRPDATFYYRLCNVCAHRTKSQRYNPGVPGILKEDEGE
jgi:regulator of replication initiation timing